MISLLLHEFKAKPRMSVNNKDIIRMYRMNLGYTWDMGYLLIIQGLISTVVGDIRYITVQNSLMYGFTG